MDYFVITDLNVWYVGFLTKSNIYCRDWYMDYQVHINNILNLLHKIHYKLLFFVFALDA
jgi:hypothetical protein